MPPNGPHFMLPPPSIGAKKRAPGRWTTPQRGCESFPPIRRRRGKLSLAGHCGCRIRRVARLSGPARAVRRCPETSLADCAVERHACPTAGAFSLASKWPHQQPAREDRGVAASHCASLNPSRLVASRWFVTPRRVKIDPCCRFLHLGFVPPCGGNRQSQRQRRGRVVGLKRD